MSKTNGAAEFGFDFTDWGVFRDGPKAYVGKIARQVEAHTVELSPAFELYSTLIPTPQGIAPMRSILMIDNGMSEIDLTVTYTSSYLVHTLKREDRKWIADTITDLRKRMSAARANIALAEPSLLKL